ncbi:MAG TPA: 3-deoxy-D-manno-octulosonic acid transferase [Candidatus Binatia bacterium]|nr:3-deoxy-D-manno-octulosonic acid transferase [Candidatus Binatia bacterium]
MILAKTELGYWVYNALGTLLLAIGLPFTPVLYLLGERYRVGLGQRLGFYERELRSSLKRTRPVWIHGASVGEVSAAGRLIDEIKKHFAGQAIVVSAFTYTGYQTAQRVITDAPVIFFPLDHPWIVKRALSTLDPSVVVFLETEIWPNMLRLAHQRGTPTLLLSGRFSKRSFSKYSSLSWFFRGVLQYFASLGMQSEEDASRATRLGASPKKVFVTGNLKLAGLANGLFHERAIPAAFDHKRRSKGHCLLVAGSTHRGEEEILLEAFRSLKQRFPDFQMVLAPRHPQRFAEVERVLKASGVGFAKKSQTNGRWFFAADICLLDTLGDLQEFYALGDVAFVGGSLVDAGGHNLLEPARVRRPVLFGPRMESFAAIATAMKEKGGGVEVRGAEDLVRELTDLLSDTKKRVTMGERAYQVAADETCVGERTAELLCRYLQA